MGTEAQGKPGWARLWPAARPFAKPMPRAGAWYPVADQAPDGRIVLEVEGRRVAIQPRFLETREDRPTRFTLVVRTPQDSNPARGTKADVGRHYAVCPACGARVSLWGQPTVVTCEECRHRGEVAYWETG